MNLVDILQMSKEEARAHLERVRWPDGPVCPRAERRHEKHDVYKVMGKSARAGLYDCRTCRYYRFKGSQFTVTVNTIFEGSHIPLNKWIGAFYLMCSSKKGISAHQLHRSLGVTYKTAWFMAHRIRLSMQTTHKPEEKLTGIVEADETFVGGKKRSYNKGVKHPIVALVERGGNVRAKAIANITGKNLEQHLLQNIDRSAILMTDQWPGYKYTGRKFAEHHTVIHSAGEYVRGNAYTNTVESFFSLLKRGVIGTFHHVSARHLDCYAKEFEFRWNTRALDDGERTDVALQKSRNKRLTYNPRLKAL